MTKLLIGDLNKGLRTDVVPFKVDNDSFPTLINMYQWRSRIKRKRGTSLLTRLNRYINSTSIQTNGSGNFSGNLITAASLETSANIVFNSIVIGSDIFTDTTPPSGILTGSTGGTGTINYATSALTITGAPATTNITFRYYPILPVMGEEDLVLQPTQFPGTITFDTTYAYNILTAFPYPNYSVSFYKNPATSSSLPGYVPKTTSTPVDWNGQNYQQFWSTNYENAFWATNGIPIPFNTTNIGMQFQLVTSTVWVSPTMMTFTLGANPLVIGDFVFANEFVSSATTLTDNTLNFQTGYVTAVGVGTVTVTFPFANITNATYIGGLLQFLTNSSNTTKDCLRWYDGDPTNGVVNSPTPTPGFGWVNFCPPLSQDNFSIGGLVTDKYYLVQARMIVPFKDRLLFFGPVIGNSGGALFYLQDTVIFSQNGTPFYNASFAGSVDSAATIFHPILTPPNQIATASAYFEDQTGFGGFQSAGISQPITTASLNEDVIIVGFSQSNARLTYTGNDLLPFNFFIINSELGDASTFSAINMDKGKISRGIRGYIITSQDESKRIDLEIPDQVFQINLTNNGNERFTAARDFINEWIYFSYKSNDNISGNSSNTSTFNNQTLLYNYRDNSWAIFNETYTSYGLFRRATGFTWQTVGLVYPSWNVWNDPWNSGNSTLLQQEVIAGNQQGFIVTRDEGTGEATTLIIQAYNNSNNTITSPFHNLSNGQYVVISGIIGTLGTFLNGNIYQIGLVTANTFQIDFQGSVGAATYLGGGLMTIAYVPQLQSKQFPAAWDMARKTRIGPQQYLFTTTENAQITLQIFLSQNADFPYNQSPIVPDPASTNNSLIYSQVLFTCPESTNLGLIPANINLQTPTAINQAQLWHRMNTSLIGDTVQFGFTLSDAQMKDQVANNAFAEIEFQAAILELNPSQLLC